MTRSGAFWVPKVWLPRKDETSLCWLSGETKGQFPELSEMASVPDLVVGEQLVEMQVGNSAVLGVSGFQAPTRIQLEKTCVCMRLCECVCVRRYGSVCGCVGGMFACVRVHLFVSMCVSVCECGFVCGYVCEWVWICVYECVGMCLYVCECVWICFCVCLGMFLCVTVYV